MERAIYKWVRTPVRYAAWDKADEAERYVWLLRLRAAAQQQEAVR
jgi:hypothetical protein